MNSHRTIGQVSVGPMSPNRRRRRIKTRTIMPSMDAVTMIINNDHLAVRCKSGGGEFPSHIATLPLILEIIFSLFLLLNFYSIIDQLSRIATPSFIMISSIRGNLH